MVLKTGANEIYEKLPTQLVTSLRCYDDMLIFSDLEQQIGPYHVYDALDNVTESVKRDNPEFDYYRTLREYQKNGQDVSTLKGGSAAWNLDKYKFLHMLEKTWRMRPNRKWYVFIEADTYLVRTNLLLWLERMDPSQSHYLGSPTFMGPDAFAHGGSGVILSGGAMEKFFAGQGDSDVAASYDEAMRDEQYGDLAFMKALKDKGVELSHRWPMLQAEKPTTIPYGTGPDNGVKHWCQPIVTMHHITPDEASTIYQFEQKRQDPKSPLLIRELENLIDPYLQPEREDWYNLSDDLIYTSEGEQRQHKPSSELSPLENTAHESFEDCRRACEAKSRCSQFVYHSDRTCGFSWSYRLGRKRIDEDGKRYRSGWLIERIERDKASDECPVVEWL